MHSVSISYTLSVPETGTAWLFIFGEIRGGIKLVRIMIRVIKDNLCFKNLE